MKRVAAGKYSIALGMLLVAALPAQAQENSVTVTPSYTNIGYDGSNARDHAAEYGIDIDGTLGNIGLRTVYSRSIVNYKLGIKELHQDNYFLRGSYKFNNVAGGTLTTGLNYFYVTNTDNSQLTDSVKAYQPTVSYLNEAGNLSLDLSYAHSRYQNNPTDPTTGKMTVEQWAPGVGFALNDGYEWVQIRGYFINIKPSTVFDRMNRTQNHSRTSAVEVSWTHFLKPNPFNLTSLGVSAVIGSRIYTVTGDSGGLSNLADTQKSAYSLSANWSLPGGWSLSTMVAEQKFQEGGFGPPYGSYKMRFGYVAASKKF